MLASSTAKMPVRKIPSKVPAPLIGARVTSPQKARRQSHRQAAFAQIEFATDSALEGTGFELPVPREIQLLAPGEADDGCRSQLLGFYKG